MAWTDLSAAFSFGSQLTSQQMQQLRDNITAVANGDSGAPEIKKDALDTGTNIDSGTLDGGDSIETTSGSEYTFFPSISGDLAFSVDAWTGIKTDYDARLRLRNRGITDNQDYRVNWRYITSSGKPFIFMLRDKNGIIKHFRLGAEPAPEYWDMEEPPEDYKWPIIPNKPAGLDAVTVFEFSQYEELRHEEKERGIILHKHLNKFYHYDEDRKIFKRKNLCQI